MQVCVQMAFYLVFPAVMDRLHSPRSWARAIWEIAFFNTVHLFLFLWFFTLGFTYWSTNLDGYDYGTAHEWPGVKIWVCFVGVIFGSQSLVLTGRREQGGRWLWVADGLTAFFTVYSAVQLASDWIYDELPFILRVFGEVVFPPFYGLWLLALTMAEGSYSDRAMRLKPFRWLGDVSFSIYVFHQPVFDYYYVVRDLVVRSAEAGGGRRLLDASTEVFAQSVASTASGHRRGVRVAMRRLARATWRQLYATDEEGEPEVEEEEEDGDEDGDDDDDEQEVDVQPWETLVVYAIVFAVASLAYYCVEKPARTHLTKLLDRMFLPPSSRAAAREAVRPPGPDGGHESAVGPMTESRSDGQELDDMGAKAHSTAPGAAQSASTTSV